MPRGEVAGVVDQDDRQVAEQRRRHLEVRGAVTVGDRHLADHLQVGQGLAVEVDRVR
jgi:hypothetical protein